MACVLPALLLTPPSSPPTTTPTTHTCPPTACPPGLYLCWSGCHCHQLWCGARQAAQWMLCQRPQAHRGRGDHLNSQLPAAAAAAAAVVVCRGCQRRLQLQPCSAAAAQCAVAATIGLDKYILQHLCAACALRTMCVGWLTLEGTCFYPFTIRHGLLPTHEMCVTKGTESACTATDSCAALGCNCSIV